MKIGYNKLKKIARQNKKENGDSAVFLFVIEIGSPNRSIRLKLFLFLFFQYDDGFDMCRLREHIVRLDIADFVASFHQMIAVACQSLRIT